LATKSNVASTKSNVAFLFLLFSLSALAISLLFDILYKLRFDNFLLNKEEDDDDDDMVADVDGA